jgi:glycosyltransferase involved in cell wall biosynthesis
MTKSLSVIIPTYNPDANRLKKTLEALQHQTLEFDKWELIIVNNNSTHPIQADLSWHPNSSIISETRQGLTYARLKGFDNASGHLIVMVDDDNVLAADYLKNIVDIFEAHPTLGAVGGKSLPIFETPPPVWLKQFYGSLALRDLGENTMISGWENKYPDCAPIGAGMGIRKTALAAYITKTNSHKSVITDRTGNSLSSGGDNDLVIELLKSGWQVGYFPSLVLQHIIPQKRMEPDYLARLEFATNRSWVMLLNSHGINPWKKIAVWTLPLRKLKSWFGFKVMGNKTNYIKWQGYCGMLKGLAEI